jgi:hypothetical protein
MHVRVRELHMSPCEGVLDISLHVQVGEPTICFIVLMGVLSVYLSLCGGVLDICLYVWVGIPSTVYDLMCGWPELWIWIWSDPESLASLDLDTLIINLRSGLEINRFPT